MQTHTIQTTSTVTDKKKGPGRPRFKEVNALGEWIDARDLRWQDVADALGIRVQYLRQLAYGEKTPSPQLALKLEEYTEGAIPMKFWYQS